MKDCQPMPAWSAHAPPRRRCPSPMVRSVSQLPCAVGAEARTDLERASAVFPFSASEYYLGLIDWTDEADPIRRLIVPNAAELEAGGSLDPSREFDYTVAPGVQHKYPSTVLFLCSKECGGSCRYCFRKRLFGEGAQDRPFDLQAGLDYVAGQPQVTNVLLTGGDPLMLPTRHLLGLIDAIVRIPHVRIIRIGSKMPAFNPMRILGDHGLLAGLRHYGLDRCRIQLMAHFDHPRELTIAAAESIRALAAHGVAAVNQCPIIRGVNDDAAVLREMFTELSHLGCPQYYVFQCRPTAGNRPYQVPLSRTYQLFARATAGIPGLAKAARLVMSHATGKIELVGLDDERIYLRYHRAFRAADRGRFLVCERDDEATWLDGLRVISEAAVAA